MPVSPQPNTIPWVTQKGQLSDRPSSLGGPNFLFSELVTWSRDTPQVRKIFEKLITDCLCSVPCYPAKYAGFFFLHFHLWHFMLWSCYSQHVILFFLQQNRVEKTSIRAFFFNPIAAVFFCFHPRNCYEVSGTSYRMCLLSASCSFTSVALKYR